MTSENLGKALQMGVFYIPNYQRDYAWGIDQFNDLWEDLKENVKVVEEKGLSDESGHFLGTIVIAPHGSYNAYDLIDGQQRMTTIFMLLTALIERSVDKDELKPQYLIKGGKPRFQVIEKNQDFFTKLLDYAGSSHIPQELQKQAHTKGQKNLCEVFNAILSNVNLPQDEINLYIDTLLAMQLIVFKESNAGRAIRTFQSVNDRGVPLKTFDKLKSLLIYYSNRYCDARLDDKINDLFGEIFEYSARIESHKHSSVVGGKDFKEAEMLRHHLGSYPTLLKGLAMGPRVTTEMTYKIIKDYLAHCKKDPQALGEFIDHYVMDLRDFFKTFVEILDQIDKNKELFECLYLENLNPRLYPTLVRLYMQPTIANKEELVELITRADFVLSKLFRTESVYDINAVIRDGGLIRDNGARSITKQELLQEIHKICIKTGKNLQSHIKGFVQSAFNTDSKAGYHYVFLKQNCPTLTIGDLLGLVTTSQGNFDLGNALGIEHICPQSWGDKEEWRGYGFSDRGEFEGLKHSYGNLLSLEKSLNSEAGDKSPEQKQAAYRRSHISYTSQFGSQVEKFDKEVIKKRNEEAIAFLKEFFKDFIG
ncbi:DUF262 domain-containing protein [Helicobacter canis]|uniref:DUF262 domain-containing protein n=1 Tax=Helicobacter canis NCTC 12740 TaxID=1357399 RepID=V8CKV4_9HELI|nr:DUF262 domain-containing protein [Helicobacter canis]ETD27732.1 hypothetical protein HMPREF2087_00652 [Helicobacter canis NCTC 12740]